MTTYDVSGLGSQVVGIAGMGIGLGLLAGTARGVMDTMYPQSRRRGYPRRARSKRYQRPYYSKQRIPHYAKYKPRYKW